jgi:acetoin:2,6-dichlorophenolindophenol oxidoreductase subunit beta
LIKKFAQAIRQGLIDEMRKDKNVVLIGEDIGLFGGAFKVTDGLFEMFGEDRVRDAPISENVIIGCSVGAAIAGLRPVAEIQFDDFLPCAMDQICNQAAKMHFMSGGQAKVPMVIRTPIGATGRGAQHSQSFESWFMHTPGLKVVMPSTPYDAKGLLISAIRDDNPVLIFEHKLLYGVSNPTEIAKESIGSDSDIYKYASEEEYSIPLGMADVKLRGKDLTVVATSNMVHKSIIAARELLKKGIQIEVIDPRTLVPLDEDTIIKSVKKTGKLLIVSEDVVTCGVASEISAIIADKAFNYLKAPIKRLSVPPTPIPFAPNNEEYVLPQVKDIIELTETLYSI